MEPPALPKGELLQIPVHVELKGTSPIVIQGQLALPLRQSWGWMTNSEKLGQVAPLSGAERKPSTH